MLYKTLLGFGKVEFTWKKTAFSVIPRDEGYHFCDGYLFCLRNADWNSFDSFSFKTFHMYLYINRLGIFDFKLLEKSHSVILLLFILKFN